MKTRAQAQTTNCVHTCIQTHKNSQVPSNIQLTRTDTEASTQHARVHPRETHIHSHTVNMPQGQSRHNHPQRQKTLPSGYPISLVHRQQSTVAWERNHVAIGNGGRGNETDQQVRVFATKPDDLSSTSGTHRAEKKPVLWPSHLHHSTNTDTKLKRETGLGRGQWPGRVSRGESTAQGQNGGPGAPGPQSHTGWLSWASQKGGRTDIHSNRTRGLEQSV